MPANKNTEDVSDIKRLLGKAHYALGNREFAKAVDILETILSAGDNAEACFLYGCVYVQQEKYGAGVEILQRARDIAPDNPNILNILGVAHFQNNSIAESLEVLRRCVKINPNNAEACGNLGLVLRHDGWHADAHIFLKRAVDGGKGSFKIILAWLDELKILGRMEELELALRPLLKARPRSVDLLVHQITVYAMKGDIAGMKGLRKRVFDLDAGNIKAIYQRAMYHSTYGDLEAMEKDIDTILQISPHHAESIFSRVHLVTKHNKTTEAIGAERQRIDAALGLESIAFDDWAMIRYAAGTLEDLAGNHDDAFRHFNEASKEVWKRQFVPEEVYVSMASDIVNFFTDSFFARMKDIVNRVPSGSDALGKGLVFIFGIPRSGTTLVEQVLSRGGQIKAGGERAEIDMIFDDLVKADPKGKPALADLNSLTLENVRKVASRYQAGVNRISGGLEYFSDKTPRSFLHLGIMAILFPRARFINCSRNPVDTCLSCYFTYFAWNSIRYSYDLKTLGLYYRLYDLIMAHWRKTLPVRILDIVYEDMVEHPKETIKELVNFCEFEWDDVYLTHDKVKAKFATASVAQVRQPIYRTSVNRWKPYENFLSPLIDQLKSDISL